tara:strand:- start:267 stop:707 length:441 start_codon:yes stop_codon:yes gene_type:complete
MNNFELQQHNCFGCGLKNDIGLKLNFTKKNDLIVGSFIAHIDYEGFPNILHGGIQSTILDEAMNWVFFIDQIFVVTTKIELKFRRPIPINESVVIQAERITENKKLYTAKGQIILESGAIATESYGEFYVMKESEKHKVIEHFNNN